MYRFFSFSFRRSTRHRDTSGFTLIELLVVIAIIGLLASMAVLAFGDARARSRDAKRASDIRQIQNAIELYREDNAGSPPDTGGVTYCLGTSSCWSDMVGSSALDAALAPYLNPIPVDPIPTRMYGAYAYRAPGRYWLPAPVGTVIGGPDSYSLAWKPDVADNQNPPTATCEEMGGFYASWDNPPGATHCPSGGTCRHCGMLYE